MLQKLVRKWVPGRQNIDYKSARSVRNFVHTYKEYEKMKKTLDFFLKHGTIDLALRCTEC